MNSIDTEKIRFDKGVLRIAATNPEDMLPRATQILKTRRAYALELRRSGLSDESRDYLEKCILWCNYEIKAALGIV